MGPAGLARPARGGRRDHSEAGRREVSWWGSPWPAADCCQVLDNISIVHGELRNYTKPSSARDDYIDLAGLLR
jgi:hypothetical protein